jgi:glycosyltransferase involved in cell wall biosynthesis
MKKVVIVTTRFPWPLTNGFANKNYWLIRGLSKKFLIDLHVIQRAPVSLSDVENIKNFCHSVHIHRPSILDLVYRLVSVVLRDRPIQLALFWSYKAERAITSSLGDAYAALSSVIRGVQYLDGYSGPVIFDLADSLGQLYTRDANKLSGFKRFVYREEGRRMLKYEQYAVQRAGKTLFFNANEAAQFDPARVTVVPHGVDPALFEIDEKDLQYSDGVVIFGRMNFEPNVHAAEWFFENVLGHLPSHIKLYIVGADPSPRVIRLAERNSRVVVTGFVDDPYPMLRGAIACVCPIQIGGGIQNKVIEGLAIGAVGLISPLAAQPMQDIESSGLVVCHSPEEWARNIMAVYQCPHSLNVNRALGREYAKKNFSWDAYAYVVTQSIEVAAARIS